MTYAGEGSGLKRMKDTVSKAKMMLLSLTEDRSGERISRPLFVECGEGPGMLAVMNRDYEFAFTEWQLMTDTLHKSRILKERPV